jgi:hypothetical protein
MSRTHTMRTAPRNVRGTRYRTAYRGQSDGFRNCRSSSSGAIRSSRRQGRRKWSSFDCSCIPFPLVNKHGLTFRFTRSAACPFVLVSGLTARGLHGFVDVVPVVASLPAAIPALPAKLHLFYLVCLLGLRPVTGASRSDRRQVTVFHKELTASDCRCYSPHYRLG